MAESLADAVARQNPWYHTFELPEGVVTDGFFDLRKVVKRVPLPESLAGKRVLDAAANEGFWSFELARRGAAEVVSVDLPDTTEVDWQGDGQAEHRASGSGLANQHFFFVQDLLGAENVERVDMNLYDLSPEAIGSFDFVFIGNVLIHLSDPFRALRAVRSVMAPHAELLSLEGIRLFMSLFRRRTPLAHLWDLDDGTTFWTPNMAAHRRLLHAAGFEVTEQGGPILQPLGNLLPKWPEKVPRTVRDFSYWAGTRRFGAPSSWVMARPLAGDEEDEEEGRAS